MRLTRPPGLRKLRPAERAALDDEAATDILTLLMHRRAGLGLLAPCLGPGCLHTPAAA